MFHNFKNWWVSTNLSHCIWIKYRPEESALTFIFTSFAPYRPNNVPFTSNIFTICHVKFSDPISKLSEPGLGKMKKELFNLRFQHVTGQLENPVKMREVKKNIARVKTIMREKNLEEAKA